MLFNFIAQQLRSHQKVLLMVVIESKGSSPGRCGFKMAVAANGTMEGSIGGGKMEIDLVNQAALLLTSDKALLKSMVHQEGAAQSSGMICSGSQGILCFPLHTQHLSVFEATSGYFNINLNEVWISESPDESALFQEAIQQKQRLYIIGGGHCALALSELATKLDFEVHLFDDRPQLNTIQKNEFAKVTIIKDYQQISTHIPVAQNQFVVVMTVGFKSDEIVIRALFEREFRYFGVLGSKAKIATLWKKLRLAGFDESRLNNIHAPIGLPISSQTPMEIAISILAEIISTLRTKR